MNKSHIRKCLFATAVAAIGGLSPIASGDITVRFDSPDVTVPLGAEFTMNIVADIPDPVVGWGLDVDLSDDSIASITAPPSIGPLWFGAGTVDGDGLAGLAFPDAISGNGILLGTLTFSADAFGETDVLLSATGGDFTEGFPLDPFGFGEVRFEPGHVTVIPAPGAALLGMIGFGTVRFLKRRLTEPRP